MNTPRPKLRFLLTAPAAFLFLVLSTVRADTFKVGPRDNIVVFGDSITSEGTYAQYMQDFIDDAYPGHGVRVIARGAHGDTARGAYARMEIDVVPWRPDWVVINFGINDVGRHTTGEFLVHYERLLNRVLRDTRARIVIASPIYQDRDTENPRLAKYVEGLRSLAEKYRAAYAPVYEETKRLRPTLPAGVRYALDGTHPNEIGHWIFAQTILRALDVPLPEQPRRFDLPARRTATGLGDHLAGTTFRLDLPMPVDVRLTAPPPPAADAKRAAKAVVIDGKLDDWDLETAPVTLGAPQQRTWGVVSWSRDRHHARAWFSWDDDALYFAIQVEDSEVRNDPGARHTVDRDCIELAIDARTPDTRSAAPYVSLPKRVPWVTQYILAPAADTKGAASAVAGFGDQRHVRNLTVASTITPYGYQLEARISASCFESGRLSAGDVIPLDITTVNLDRTDRYLTNTSFRWSGSRSSAISNREYGLVTLRRP